MSSNEKRNGVGYLLLSACWTFTTMFLAGKDIVSWRASWGYRNKIELAFKRNGNKPQHVCAFHGQDIVRISDCPLLDKSNQKAVTPSGALSYLSLTSFIGTYWHQSVQTQIEELEVAPPGPLRKRSPRTQVARFE